MSQFNQSALGLILLSQLFALILSIGSRKLFLRLAVWITA